MGGGRLLEVVAHGGSTAFFSSVPPSFLLFIACRSVISNSNFITFKLSRF